MIAAMLVVAVAGNADAHQSRAFLQAASPRVITCYDNALASHIGVGPLAIQALDRGTHYARVQLNTTTIEGVCPGKRPEEWRLQIVVETEPPTLRVVVESVGCKGFFRELKPPAAGRMAAYFASVPQALVDRCTP